MSANALCISLAVGAVALLAFAPGAAMAADACSNASQAVRAQQDAAFLPDCRAYELVSPADKGPSGSVAEAGFLEQVKPQASIDGEAFAYPIQNGIPDSTAGGWTRWQAARTGDGWRSGQLTPPSLVRPPAIEGGFAVPGAVRHASPNLACAIVDSYSPLTADVPQLSIELGLLNLFRRNADGSFDLITDRVPLNPDAVFSTARDVRQIETSEDCDRVYFVTPREFIDGASGLYEWDEGTLRDAGVRPDGSVGPKLGEGEAGSAAMGGEVAPGATIARWSAVTPEGSLFFTAVSNDGPNGGKRAIFMRSEGGASVVDISQSETATAANGARFEVASEDGGTVLFAANHGLDAEAGLTAPTGGDCATVPSGGTPPPIEAKPCDLYAYDVVGGELTDLTPDANPEDPLGAAVQGAVAIDDDASHVYFAALGQIVPGKGRTYAENTAGSGSANIYLSTGGELTYVVTLERGNENTGDLFGGGTSGGNGALMRRATKWSAQASADGSRLVFESAANLTGYDSGGVNMVYLYDAEAAKISCLSCPPGGGPTLVDPNRLGQLLGPMRSVTLTYRPRVMSEDGSRVFFTSPDVLAPGAEPGETKPSPGGGAPRVAKTNVYQWHQGEVALMAIVTPSGANGYGEYLDASADGEDVFIATNQQLAPHDRDFVADVYNVKAGGGFLFVEPPPNCQVDDSAPLQPNQAYCQELSGPRSARPVLPSSAFKGPGDVTPPRPNRCARRARRAQALSRRAQAMRRRAAQARKSSKPRAAHRNARRARRAAGAARRNSKAAKRCRRARARAANLDRGGAR